MVRENEHMRCAKELRDIITYIKLQYMKKGLIPPTSKEITKKIGKTIDKEALFYNEFVKI